MTTVILPFRKHPVRPARDGGWLVVWRGCGWLHGSRADAREIAVIHYAKIIAPREGGAA